MKLRASSWFRAFVVPVRCSGVLIADPLEAVFSLPGFRAAYNTSRMVYIFGKDT